MMRRLATAAACATALIALTGIPAHAQVTLGRLFTTPAERTTLETGRNASAALAPNSQGEQPAAGVPAGPGMPGTADATTGSATPAALPPPPALVMSGVLRRSGSRDTTVWLNDQPQYRAQKNLSQRSGAAAANLTVTLPSGKKVLLKPGQRYDLQEGRIKDVNEP
ncbi:MULTISPECIES: hypothetical protein [unclassified Duganella]|uniref:hypothetical protein n=1 Tax=unclassified Duganella TaxID=2636909 RepID=UPI000890F54B|nr:MULTISPECIES: hypothetical protein [unclassified Duganella]SDG54611.1 hypothetical protein SAMN05216320_105160 [Duganella sp. OV458]SDJ77240.1 hypothetical protein SAMN05428973_106161 [Duganella sp. OV510]